MSELIKDCFLAATMCYFVSLFFISCRYKTGAVLFLIMGCLCNALSLVIRYYISFPLLPLYQGSYFIPCIVGLLYIRPLLSRKGHLVQPLLVSCLAATALLFPNDYYLPFLQFKTPFSHLFFLFGVMGKALFLMTGVTAFLILTGQKDSTDTKKMIHIAMWGFFFWTLSIFSGAIWSYLGWGSPVIWDDPILTSTMAMWLYYILFLHLHLTQLHGPRPRAILALAGAFGTFFTTCLPELGIFRLPGGFF
ncbi:cytochrome c biogenesis protein CcsA [Desulfocicer niacini]